MNEIIHGDCLEVMKNMSDNSVDMVLTDIPYGKVTQNGEERAKYNGQMRKIDKGVADVETFDIQSFLAECVRVCKGNIYIFCASEQVSEIRLTLAEKYKLTTRHCIWEKTNPSPMNGQHMWLSGIENCIYAKKRGSVHNEHCKNTVWRFPNGRSKVHPTEKTVALFEYLVRASSDEGMTILDPCAGSGTTAVAALNTARNFICIEKESEYVQIAETRIKNATPSLF